MRINFSKKEIKRMVRSLLEIEMKKLDVKLLSFNELENLFELERQQMKSMQSQIFADKISLALSKAELNNNLNRKASDVQRKSSMQNDSKISPPKNDK